MTTIVYRDGVMAGDMRGVWGEWSRASETKVLVDARLGLLVGICGAASVMTGVRRTLADAPADMSYGDFVSMLHDIASDLDHLPADDRSGVLLALGRFLPGGHLARRLAMISRGGVEHIAAPWHAMGGDAAIAVGALAMGATARQAVAVAIRHGVCSGGDVEWVELGGSDRVYRDAVSDLVPPPPEGGAA